MALFVKSFRWSFTVLRLAPVRRGFLYSHPAMFAREFEDRNG
jgi:hypothetical protein